MSITEVITGLNKNDASVKKYLFETYFGKLSAISLRYSKSAAQSSEVFNTAFNACLFKLQRQKNNPQFDLDAFMEKEFIQEVVDFIKNIRSEYYVASTVYATSKDNKNYDLFEANDLIDFNAIDNDILVKSLQQLVPSQRLIFNLHVIENYTLEDSSLILEASEQTAKSNLEKARYNLQKNIEKSLKEQQYEQSF
ncbi:MAG: polymerase subunit sigma-24 [Bacteroidetes bacterium]|jgi:RNA polymerase sigma-70 factor (ECF subfamily)|nr:polymerase subunit sigma-24 [Bacteroidota bacterium]